MDIEGSGLRVEAPSENHAPVRSTPVVEACRHMWS